MDLVGAWQDLTTAERILCREQKVDLITTETCWILSLQAYRRWTTRLRYLLFASVIAVGQSHRGFTFNRYYAVNFYAPPVSCNTDTVDTDNGEFNTYKHPLTIAHFTSLTFHQIKQNTAQSPYVTYFRLRCKLHGSLAARQCSSIPQMFNCRRCTPSLHATLSVYYLFPRDG